MNLEDYKRALSSDSLTEATGILIHMLAIELHSGQKDKLGGLTYSTSKGSQGISLTTLLST